MRKTSFLSQLAAGILTLGLLSCNIGNMPISQIGTAIGSLTPNQIVQLGCGFSVTAAELLALAKADATITTIEQAGAIICQQANNQPVTPAAKATRYRSVIVRGVVIHLRKTR